MDYILEISNLKMKYGRSLDYVLKGVDLKVKPGQIIGYIGPNGAGKSTTVKIILGMIHDYEGEVLVFNQNIKDHPVDYKLKVGYVPEIANLYDSLSAYEYIDFIGKLYGLDKEIIEEKSQSLFELFGILEALHDRIASYSKGMKQKLMIIASLIHNPDLLFFDEPINGLDANSVMIFKSLIKKLSQEGKTIFYSSHIMEVVEKISDRIIVLNNGVVVADDHFDDLKTSLHQGSLQDIFNQLTGFNTHDDIAHAMVETIIG